MSNPTVYMCVCVYVYKMYGYGDRWMTMDMPVLKHKHMCVISKLRENLEE